MTMSMTAEQLKYQQDAVRKYQAFYDETCRKVGTRAPEPVLGQDVNDYRRETLRMMKMRFLPQNHPLYKIQMRGLHDTALDPIEGEVLKAVPQEFYNPATVAPGELRKIEVMDEYGKVKTVDFVGDSFVKQFTVPGRSARFWNDRAQEWFPPKRPQRTTSFSNTRQT
jgi:hypothetical protein